MPARKPIPLAKVMREMEEVETRLPASLEINGTGVAPPNDFLSYHLAPCTEERVKELTPFTRRTAEPDQQFLLTIHATPDTVRCIRRSGYPRLHSLSKFKDGVFLALVRANDEQLREALQRARARVSTPRRPQLFADREPDHPPYALVRSPHASSIIAFLAELHGP